MTTADDIGLDGGAVPDRTRTQRRAVTALVLSQIVGGVGMGAALSVGGLVARDLTGSQTWAGMATTMVTLGAALFALPLAGAAMRRGRRAGLGLGWFLAALGGLVAIIGAQMGSFPVFLAGMVLFGSGTAANLQSRHAAADLAHERTRGRDLSIVVWATTIGSVAGPNLISPGAAVAGRLSLDPLLGPFVFSTASFAIAGVLTAALLRPDPLLLARRLAGGEAGGGNRRPPLTESIAAIGASPTAMLAVVGIVAGHAVMVMVMTMTPVHMEHGGAELTIIGLTISLHIAGMYALSPVVGWLADRYGRIPVLLAGQAILLCSALVSGLAGHDSAWMITGLVLLGLGWSFGLVSASTLLAESLPADRRTGAQGAADLLMNLGGAVSGALSGVVLAAMGFGLLNAVAALLVLPVLLLAGRVLLARRTRKG
ncbi:MAG: MFS transporter [Nocardiopsaceae bacterium]|nr:MFS transporter [Nocardiopsaceae bacterium]